MRAMTKTATTIPPDAARPAPDARTPIFHAQGLTQTYMMGDVPVRALQGVDLDLLPGEFVVILGPSGSGKSTLLNILGGLDAPTSGTVVFSDHNLVGAHDRELTLYRREHVGFVFQFYHLIPSLTARENVALVTDLGARAINAAEALCVVGLGERMDHFPAQMSGGEQQRVAIAQAIAKQPDVLLCDEPTGFDEPGGLAKHVSVACTVLTSRHVQSRKYTEIGCRSKRQRGEFR